MNAFNEEMTLVFNTPITIGKGDTEVVFESVKLREPMAVELGQASRELTPVDGVIKLVQLVGGIPLLAAQKIKQRDINRASAFFSSFNAGPEAAADGPN